MEELSIEVSTRQENEELLACSLKMLENIELQIGVTYEYESLKALYTHKEVITTMINKYQQKLKEFTNCPQL